MACLLLIVIVTVSVVNRFIGVMPLAGANVIGHSLRGIRVALRSGPSTS